jgi:hypothetical protein
MASPQAHGGIVVNRAAIGALLRGPEVLADVARRAHRIAAAAGAGYEADSSVGRRRARGTARTATVQAMHAEATSGNLRRAIDAGRGD